MVAVVGCRSGYTESFLEHYLLGVIYLSGLTRAAQLALAAMVVVINIAVYCWLARHWPAQLKGL